MCVYVRACLVYAHVLFCLSSEICLDQMKGSNISLGHDLRPNITHIQIYYTFKIICQIVRKCTGKIQYNQISNIIKSLN